MTDLISNSVRRDTQNFALLSANFGPAYVEENSYSFSIQISKTPQILLFRHATKCYVNPPPPSHSPNRNMRSVVEHLLSDPMVMGSNPALGTPSWTEIQFHESTEPGSSFVELPYRSSIKTMLRVNQTISDFNNFTKNSELSAA